MNSSSDSEFVSINLINMNLNCFQEICQDLKKLKNRADYTEVYKAIHDVREAVWRKAQESNRGETAVLAQAGGSKWRRIRAHKPLLVLHANSSFFGLKVKEGEASDEWIVIPSSIAFERVSNIQ